MRACEGCRRRKIKCDAATTNSWPCGACQRLKLQCVPPMVQYDREYSTNPSNPDFAIDFGGSGVGMDNGQNGYGGMRKQSRTGLDHSYIKETQDGFGSSSPHSPHHDQLRHLSQTSEMSFVSLGPMDGVDAPPVRFSPPYHEQSPPPPPPVSIRQPSEEFAAGEELAAQLVGSLQINDTGVGKQSLHHTSRDDG